MTFLNFGQFIFTRRPRFVNFSQCSGPVAVCRGEILQGSELCLLCTLVCPSVPVYPQRNLTEYFVAVDVNNMLQLYASMLHERRIIITSSKLSTVSPFPTQSLSQLRVSYQRRTLSVRKRTRG